MTTPPTFPPADPSGSWQPPTSAPPPAPGQSGTVRPSRLRTGLVLGGAATAALVLVGGGVYAYGALDGGGAQPEDVFPDTAIAYARVDLDPSAAQKVNLLRLANRFPDLAAELDVDLSENADVRKLLVDAITKSGTCDIDYATDVEPWIGHRAAVAVLPAADGKESEEPGKAPEPEPVLALQVTDEGAARKAFESGLGCGDGVKPAQLAFVDGYALITEAPLTAAEVAAAATKAPLTDDALFSADMKALGDPGLVSFWADIEGLGGLLDGQADAEQVQAAIADGLRSMSGTARAGSDHLELAVAVGADEKLLTPLKGSGTSLITTLPDSTLLATAGAVTPEMIDRTWEQLSALADTAGSGSLGDLGGSTDLFGKDWSLSSHDVGTTTALPASPEADCLAQLALPENAIDFSGWGLTAEEEAQFTQEYDTAFMESCTGDFVTDGTELGTGTAADATGILGEGLSGTSPGDDLVPSGLGFQETVDELEKVYDIKLPEDIKTLFGKQIVVAVDSTGLEDLSAVTGLGDVDLGIRTVGDKAAIEDLLVRIDKVLVDAGAEKLRSATTKDGLVLASNDDYAKKLAGAGTLGSQAAFKTVVPDASSADSAAYLDIDAIEAIARANIDEFGGDDSWLASIEPLQAFGVSSRVTDGHSVTRLRVSFD